MGTAKITHEKRLEIEQKIYDTFSAVDKTNTNTEYYQKIFCNMTDSEFYNFLERRLPFRLHIDLFDVSPTMKDFFDAFKVLEKPLLEKVKLPFKYINKDGIPIESKEAIVGYINGKRMKQMLIEKNNIAVEINKRDYKTGRLISDDKGGQMTSKEFESAASFGFENTIDEFSRIRADAMDAKAKGYSLIASTGVLRKDDVPIESDDSLGKNLVNVYLMGANIYSNLVNEEYMTPYTLKNSKRTVIDRD